MGLFDIFIATMDQPLGSRLVDKVYVFREFPGNFTTGGQLPFRPLEGYSAVGVDNHSQEKRKNKFPGPRGRVG